MEFGLVCTNNTTGNYDPYQNCCQRVLELFERLKMAEDDAARWEKQWIHACGSVTKLQGKITELVKELKELKEAKEAPEKEWKEWKALKEQLETARMSDRTLFKG